MTAHEQDVAAVEVAADAVVEVPAGGAAPLESQLPAQLQELVVAIGDVLLREPWLIQDRLAAGRDPRNSSRP